VASLIAKGATAVRLFTIDRCRGVLPHRWWLRVVVDEGRARGDSLLDVVAAPVSPGTCLVDVGANAGVYVATGLYAGSDVIAIEPLPELAAKLRERYPSATVLEAATSAGAGVMPLHVPVREGTEFYTRASLSADANEGFELRSLTVATNTLDNLVGDRAGKVSVSCSCT